MDHRAADVPANGYGGDNPKRALSESTRKDGSAGASSVLPEKNDPQPPSGTSSRFASIHRFRHC